MTPRWKERLTLTGAIGLIGGLVLAISALNAPVHAQTHQTQEWCATLYSGGKVIREYRGARRPHWKQFYAPGAYGVGGAAVLELPHSLEWSGTIIVKPCGK